MVAVSITFCRTGPELHPLVNIQLTQDGSSLGAVVLAEAADEQSSEGPKLDSTRAVPAEAHEAAPSPAPSSTEKPKAVSNEKQSVEDQPRQQQQQQVPA